MISLKEFIDRILTSEFLLNLYKPSLFSIVKACVFKLEIPLMRPMADDDGGGGGGLGCRSSGEPGWLAAWLVFFSISDNLLHYTVCKPMPMQVLCLM